MEIPHTELSQEILREIVKEFVLQEGTDYGEGDFSLESKIEQVLKQLESGRAVVVYDQATESCSIVRAK